jgi:hypothetical protein
MVSICNYNNWAWRISGRKKTMEEDQNNEGGHLLKGSGHVERNDWKIEIKLWDTKRRESESK